MNILSYAEEIGLLLALAALVVGFYHLREIQKVIREARAQEGAAKAHTTELQTQTAALQKQTANLDEVRQSLSTRYLGQFPQYYPNIVELLKRANRDVIIFCDFPGYGSFSDSESWLDYKHTLENKVQKEQVRVTLTCLDYDRRIKCLNDQLFKTQTWTEWKEKESNQTKLKRLLMSHGSKQTIDQLTKEEFFAILEKDEQRALDETFAEADVSLIDSYVPLHFWLIDGISAVFAIPSFSAVEYGFSTTDQKLISAFTDMKRRYDEVINIPSGPLSNV